MDRDGPGSQIRRQVASKPAHSGAKAGQGQAPKHHGAFVAAPGARNAIEQRLGRMRIGHDIGHGEITGDKGVDQGGKADAQGQEDSRRCPLSGAGQQGAIGSGGGQHQLDHGKHQGQNQAERTDLDDHAPVALPGEGGV